MLDIKNNDISLKLMGKPLHTSRRRKIHFRGSPDSVGGTRIEPTPSFW